VNGAGDQSLGDECISVDEGRSTSERRPRRPGPSKMSPTDEPHMGPRSKSGSARWWQRGFDGDGWMGHTVQDHGQTMHCDMHASNGIMPDYYGTMGRQSPYITHSQAPYVARQDSLRLHDVHHDVLRPVSAQSNMRSRPSSAHSSFSTERTSLDKSVRGWRRKTVHKERVWQELENLARLLHLPGKKLGQSLDEYVEHLRIAAQYGMGHYARTTNLPPPKHSVPVSIDSLYSHTARPKSALPKRRRPHSAGPHSSYSSAQTAVLRGERRGTALNMGNGNGDDDDGLVRWAQHVEKLESPGHGRLQSSNVQELGATERRDVSYMHLMRLLDKASSVRRAAFKVVDEQRSSAASAVHAGVPEIW
jgi:hypothetical protein